MVRMHTMYHLPIIVHIQSNLEQGHPCMSSRKQIASHSSSCGRKQGACIDDQKKDNTNKLMPIKATVVVLLQWKIEA